MPRRGSQVCERACFAATLVTRFVLLRRKKPCVRFQVIGLDGLVAVVLRQIGRTRQAVSVTTPNKASRRYGPLSRSPKLVPFCERWLSTTTRKAIFVCKPRQTRSHRLREPPSSSYRRCRLSRPRYALCFFSHRSDGVAAHLQRASNSSLRNPLRKQRRDCGFLLRRHGLTIPRRCKCSAARLAVHLLTAATIEARQDHLLSLGAMRTTYTNHTHSLH